MNPEGTNGAVRGFIAPLNPNATRDALTAPLEHGHYALATLDRKTVLRLLVVSREDVRFDPDLFVNSPYARGLSEDLLQQIRATWVLLQVRFETYDPAVYPSLDFLLDTVQRLGELTDGTIGDRLSLTYLFPSQVRQGDLQPIDARNFVIVRFEDEPEGIRGETLGMCKFGLNEFCLVVEESDHQAAGNLLMSVCQSILIGRTVGVGDRVAGFEVLPARDGNPLRWELVPPPNRTAHDLLAGNESSGSGG